MNDVPNHHSLKAKLIHKLQPTRGEGWPHEVPTLVDDGPGWVVAGLVVLEQDGQEGDARQEATGAELQYAPAVPTCTFRCHHQHWKSAVFCPARRGAMRRPVSVICCLWRGSISTDIVEARRQRLTLP
jgi:hypothetical protein